MGRLEVHPVDASLFVICAQPSDRVDKRAVRGIAGVALRHHHEIWIEFILHVDCCAIARNRLVQCDDLDAGALRRALAFDRLVVNAYPGDAAADAFTHLAAHCHDAAVTGVAIHDHRDRDAVGNPPGDRHALGHRRGADIGQARIGAHHPAGADEQRLATGLLHDPRMCRCRRVHDGQYPIVAINQPLKVGRS
jgi:hypothetical protein